VIVSESSDRIPDPDLIPCEAPLCPTIMDITDDGWIQLDIPDMRFKIFCSIKCLYCWLRDLAEDGFIALETQWKQPRSHA